MPKPERGIKTFDDLNAWTQSEAYHDVLGMIIAIGKAVEGKKQQCDYPKGEMVTKLAALIDDFSNLVDEIPALQQPQRFGNKAYRTWLSTVCEKAPNMLLSILPENVAGYTPELESYLCESFGNATRIDYGTGHELMFAAFLCCLFKIELLGESDSVAVAFLVVDKYVRLCRKLQTTYRMEPAGSQGVWSLDDFQFIPYIFGASQLIGTTEITPKSIPDLQMAQKMADENLFFACTRYIHSMKTGPFSEHSSTLYSVSGVPNWEKVFVGCIKMYKAEVLGKFPVVQHFLFGSLLTLKRTKTPAQI